MENKRSINEASGVVGINKSTAKVLMRKFKEGIKRSN
jgi:hypothetical protein